MRGRTTYWHLEAMRRKPGDYDIASSKLLYYPDLGIAVDTPGKDWLRKYQTGSALQSETWEEFRDPRETTYAQYTQLQHTKELFIDGLFRSVEGTEHDADLSAQWVELLESVLPVLRYPIHGFQMVSAYVGSMAPTGKLVIAAGFQAADEVRRIQRIAYRMRQLQLTYPDFGSRSKDQWQNAPQWQPLRRVVEHLLATYDWGEALVALNLVMKPLFDEVFLAGLARVAEEAQDRLLPKILFSFDEDGQWHRAWSAALFRMLNVDDDSHKTVQGWIDTWYPRAREAMAPFEAMLVMDGDGGQATLEKSCHRLWAASGVTKGVQ